MPSVDDEIRVTFQPGSAPPDPNTGATEDQFNSVRRTLLKMCAQYGSVGPTSYPDDCAQDTPRPQAILPSAVAPEFYVVDDYYGATRRIYIEPTVEALSAAWLISLAQAMESYHAWDALVILGGGISILVAPRVITFVGWSDHARELTPAIEEIRSHLRSRVALIDEARDRRRMLVSELLRAAWRLTNGSSLILVAVFRTRSDGTPGDSVWLLHHDDKSVFDLDSYEFDPDAVRPSAYWALPSGQMFEYGSGDVPAGGNAAMLAEWALVHRGEAVSGAKSLRVRKANRVWTFDLQVH